MNKKIPKSAAKSTGEIIANFRKDQGMTQAQFSKELGIKQQMLSFYEKGMQPPVHFIVSFKKKTGIDLLFDKIGSADGVEIENLRTENNLLRTLVEEQSKRLALYEKLAAKKLRTRWYAFKKITPRLCRLTNRINNETRSSNSLVGQATQQGQWK